MSTLSGSNNQPKGPVTVLGNAYVGETLIARPNGVGDSDGIDFTTIAFQWMRDGNPIDGATEREYDVSFNDVGSHLSVQYSYTDFGGTLEVLTSDPEAIVPPAGTPIPVDTAAFNDLVVLGDALVGERLTARPNAVTDSNDINYDTTTFQWLRDGTPIPGATAQTYDVTNADVDAEISVQFSYVDLLGNATSLNSNPKQPVPVPPDEEEPPAPPVNEQDDFLTGTADADHLRAASGLKRIDGFEQTDTVFFGGDQSNYTIIFEDDAVSVSDHRIGGLGIIELENVELIDFESEIAAFVGPFDIETFGGLAQLDQQDAEAIVELYIAYFNRAPDAIGLNFWASAFSNGTSLDQMASLFAGQSETQATYPEGTSNTDFANSVYANVLGRAPDQVGLTFWVDALDEGTVTRDKFILQILEGARSPLKIAEGHDFILQQLADREYLENKIDIGAQFAVHRGMSDIANANTVMQLFDGTPDSILDAVNAIDTFYQEARSPFDGEFLLQVVGVMNEPFAI